MNYMKTVLMSSAALLALSACDMMKQNPKTADIGTLSRTLFMVDESGTRYGMVEMNPATGGRVLNSQGQLIGTIVIPTVTSSVTTVTPTVSPVPTPQPYAAPVAAPYTPYSTTTTQSYPAAQPYPYR